MKNVKEKPRISPEDYKKVIKGLDLKSISLKECKASINTEIKIPQELSIKIKDESEYKQKEDEILIFHKYSVDVRKPESKSKFIQAEITLMVKMTSQEEFTDDFFEIYKNVSLHLNTWPYFREYINQISARMNVPPLTLPFYKTP